LVTGESGLRRYYFYTCASSLPASLKKFRNKQQDARQYTHCGPLAATNWSVDLKKECMGVSFILVDKPGSEALIVFSAPVGLGFRV
jgi:hypothetical protein